jgi:hypothetical protein
MDDKHRPLSEVEKWIMNERQNFEDWRYKHTINNYNTMIAELHKMYDSNTDGFMRSRIQSTLKQSKRELAKLQIQYEKFKRVRTAISK